MFHRTGTRAFEQREVPSGDKPALQHGNPNSCQWQQQHSRTAERRCVADTQLVSFHFGVPAPERVQALRDAGITLLASATNPEEAYDAGKALNAAAKAKGEHGYGAQWAGQGAPLARALPAAKLVSTLVEEMQAAP